MDAARSYYRQALRKAASNSETHFRLGAVAAQSGDVAEAMGYYRQTLRLDPDHAGALYALAQLLLAQDKRQEGEQMIQAFVRLKEYEGRLNSLVRAVERAPRDPQLRYDVALCHLEFGRLHKAAEELQRILTIDPGFAAARLRLEEIDRLREEKDRAG